MAIAFDYNSRRWRHKRKETLRRDGYLCQHCKRYGKQVQAVTAHHIKHTDEYPDGGNSGDGCRMMVTRYLEEENCAEK